MTSTDRFGSGFTASGPAEGETIRAAVGRWTIVGLAITLWLYALFGPEGVRTQIERERRVDALSQQLDRARQKTHALELEVEQLESDDLAIERAIRSSLDLQRPGEKVLLAPSEPPVTRSKR